MSPLGLAGMPGVIGGGGGSPAPVAPRSGRERGGSPEGGDRYAGGPAGASAEDAPFWLLMWQADRRSGRRVLDRRQTREAAALESEWIAAWLDALAPALSGWRLAASRPRLAAWQTVTEAIVAAGGPFPAPLVVFQAALTSGRGQFVFRHPRALIQLAPSFPGSPGEWYGTLAHEAMHHAQYDMVARLYQGHPLPAPWDALARYYRDAIATYRVLSPACPPEVHKTQPLEHGPWKLGGAIAKAIDD